MPEDIERALSALQSAEKPLVIVGEGAVSHGAALSKQIGRDTIALAAKLATGPSVEEGWNGYAMLHNAAARVGGLDIGFVPGKGGVCSLDQLGLADKGELDVLFLLGAEAGNHSGSSVVVGGLLGLAAATVLGFVLIGLSAGFAQERSTQSARRLFIFSILYLLPGH